MVVALDTNVLVRYFIQENPEQHALAKQCIARHCTVDEPGFINRIVLCELAWVLERFYGYEKLVIADMLEMILRTDEFSLENATAVWQALGIYRKNNVDFADALMGVINTQAGYPKTTTFDKKTAKLNTFELLS